MHGHGSGGVSLLIPSLLVMLAVTPFLLLALWRRAGVRNSASAAEDADDRQPWRYELTRNKTFKRLLRWRGFQFALQLPNALIFILVIVAGIWGTQIGDLNFATVFTWLVWWAVIIFTFLLLSRLWCAACPLVSFAEWLQRGRLWGVSRRFISLNRKWPKPLRNFWIPTGFFIILTWMYLFLDLAGSPFNTAMVTIFLFIGPAIVVSLIFERRTFCRYVCPIGGVIGVYSLSAPLELRRRDEDVCRACKERTCYRGNDDGYGCPMLERPWKMDNNAYCTLCAECVKSCSHDNITVNARPFLTDLWRPGGLRFDAAVIVVILLGITVFQTLEMVEPWMDATAGLMTATGLGEKTVLTISYLLLAVLAPLAIFAAWSLMSWRSGGGSYLAVFIAFSFAFLPIALTSHLAHNLVHFFAEGGAAIPVISDPLGRGWDLFGTASFKAGPLLGTDPMRYLQSGLVLTGFFAAVYAGWRISGRLFAGGRGGALKGLAPMLVLMVAFAALNLWLLNLPMSMRE